MSVEHVKELSTNMYPASCGLLQNFTLLCARFGGLCPCVLIQIIIIFVRTLVPIFSLRVFLYLPFRLSATHRLYFMTGTSIQLVHGLECPRPTSWVDTSGVGGDETRSIFIWCDVLTQFVRSLHHLNPESLHSSTADIQRHRLERKNPAR